MKRLLACLLAALVLALPFEPAARAEALSITVTPSVTSLAVGGSITWTIAVQSGAATGYYFDIYRDGACVERSKTYSAFASYTYTAARPGKYTARGWAKDATGAKVNQTSVATVVAGDLAVASVTLDKANPAVGDTLTWTANATGGAGRYRYYFTIYKDGARVAGSATYGASAAYAYTPSEPGTYKACGWVKDAAGAKAYRNSANCVVTNALTVSSLTADKTAARVGEAIAWTAAAEGGAAGYTYYFDIYRDGVRVGGSSAYGAGAVYRFTPDKPGAYTARAWVKDATGAKANRVSEVTTVSGGLANASVTPDKTSASTGETITWTATATG